MTKAACNQHTCSSRCNRHISLFAFAVTIIVLSFFHTTDSTAAEWPQAVVPLGVNVGYGGNGYIIGGEISCVRLMNNFGAGVYMDGLKTRDDLRSNLGVEFFMLMSGPPIMAGIEFGPAVRRVGGKIQKGFSVELFTFAYILPYCRYSVFRNERIFEAGFLAKIPITAD